MEDGAVYAIVVIIGIFGTFFNVATLVIIFCDRMIRKRASYVPIISFLVGSAIQGATAFPIYVFRKLESHQDHFPDGVCDAYRVPYFYCGHMMKLSLFYVSLDRLIAIKFPYDYCAKISTKRFAAVMVASWIVTFLVDLVPFFSPTNFVDDCVYRPNKEWGVTVIILFNIIPLITIIVCYSLIWYVALKMTTNDMHQQPHHHHYQKQQQQQQQHNQKSNSSNKKENKSETTSEYACYNQGQKNSKCDKSVDLGKSKAGNCHDSPSNKYGKHIEFTLVEAAKTIHDKTSNGFKRLQRGMELKATKTSLVLIITYIICWGPLGIFYMVDHFCDYCYSAQDHLSEFRTVVKILAFTSSFLAPLSYCWWNQEFRESAIKFVKKRFCK